MPNVYVKRLPDLWGKLYYTQYIMYQLLLFQTSIVHLQIYI